MLVIKSPPGNSLLIENLQVVDSKQNIVFEQNIAEDILWAKQTDIWVGTLFCDNEIRLNDTVGVMRIGLKLNGQYYEIAFKLDITKKRETHSFFSAGLSI